MERGFHGEEEEDEDDHRGYEEWENIYSNERSWESLIEDEHGCLRLIDSKKALHDAQFQRRLRKISTTGIQKSLIRYLYIVVDLSQAASETDYKPSRMVVIARQVEAFVKEFFDQNPLSKVGLITLRDGVAQCLTDLQYGSSESRNIEALMGKSGCSGDASLQNGLDLVHDLLNQAPASARREVLILFSALSSRDPGDVMETIQKCKESKIRCSVIGLSAQVHICKYVCQETSGVYAVALDEPHLKELVFDHVPPPPAIAGIAVADLIETGFPQGASDGVISMCSCHGEIKVGGGYICPRCKARVCELPTQCCICGLTLVSTPHLARSYHHLFPMAPFEGVPNHPRKLPKKCFGCQQGLIGTCVACPKCKHCFCHDCDIYIHESLHNCPGCESFGQSKSATDKEKKKRKHNADKDPLFISIVPDKSKLKCSRTDEINRQL